MDDIAGAMASDHLCTDMPRRHVVTPGVAAQLTGVDKWRLWSAMKGGYLKRFRHRTIAHSWCVNVYEVETKREALMRRHRPKRYHLTRRWQREGRLGPRTHTEPG